jgi:hypothetical protein
MLLIESLLFDVEIVVKEVNVNEQCSIDRLDQNMFSRLRVEERVYKQSRSKKLGLYAHWPQFAKRILAWSNSSSVNSKGVCEFLYHHRAKELIHLFIRAEEP